MQTKPLVVLIIFACCCRGALGDGGTVQLSEVRGDIRATVFTSPNPLRAGPVDISVMLQNSNSGTIVEDAQTFVRITSDASTATIAAEATRAAATNKLMLAAVVNIPAPGVWHVRLETLLGAQRETLSFTMNVGPPQPRWTAEWLSLGWPIVAVGLFVIHRWRIARR